MQAEAQEYREKLIEKVSEADDKLLEKYLSGEESREAEIKARAARRARSASVRDDKQPTFVPVICGSAFKNKGVQPLLDAVVDFLPSPLDVPPVVGLDPTDAKEAATDRAPRPPTRRRSAALAFKIMTDPFVGQLTFFRVYSGVLHVRVVGLQRDQGQAPSASAAS